MVFSSGTVVGEGGVEFVIEVAEPDFSAIDADGSEPFLLTLTERDASVARVGF